jgi:DNA-binding transcriptional ArsR family regulator
MDNQGAANLAEELADCQDALIAIGDKVRLKILYELLKKEDNKGVRVGELGKITGLSRPAISHHMKYLKKTGIISVRKEGTKNFYYLDGKKSKLNDLSVFFAHASQAAKDAPDYKKKTKKD